MNARGTIFCQFGEYANHVGAHFWNIQQQQYLNHKKLKKINKSKSSPSNQIDNNLFFRKTTSTSSSDITEKVITPRVLILEFKDNLGNLKKLGYLNQEDNEHPSQQKVQTWDAGKVEIIKETNTRKPLQFFKSLFPAMNEDGDEEQEYYDEQGKDLSHDHDDDEAFFNRKKGNSKMSKEKEAALDNLNTKKNQIFSAPKSKTEQNVPKEQVENKGMSEQEKHFRMIEELTQNSKTWSDFLKPDLHSRTIFDIKKEDIEENPETEDEFWNFNYQKGVDNFDKLNSKSDDDSMEEQLHFLLEESDFVNSFQISTDAYNGWGGFTSRYIEDLILDHVGTKTAIMTFGCNPFISSFGSV